MFAARERHGLTAQNAEPPETCSPIPRMTTTRIPPVIPYRRRTRWLPIVAVVLVLVLLPPTLVVVGVYRCLSLSADASSLRRGVMKASGAAWDKQIELGVGPLLLSGVRAGLAFVELPDEARAALRAVRGAEVGVYRRHEPGLRLSPAAMLSAADAAMTARGWDRVVGVTDPRELVAIYVPKAIRSARDVRTCLVVVDEREMVVVSARGNLEPLLEVAMRRHEWRTWQSSLRSGRKGV